MELTASGYDPAPTVRVSVDGGSAREVPLGPVPPFGTVRADVLIPDAEKAQAVSLTRGTRRADAHDRSPRRAFAQMARFTSRLPLTPTSATPTSRRKTLEGHNQDTDKAIELAKAYPDYRWNLEVAVQAESYLANRARPAGRFPENGA